MADTAALPLVRALSQKLSSFSGVAADKELGKIRRTLAELEPFVVDAEDRLVESDAEKFWLTDVKDAVYDAEDILDQFLSSTNKVRNLFSLKQNPLVFRSKMEHEIEDIRERLDKLSSNWRARHQSVANFVDERPNLQTRITTWFLNDGSQIYGREDDKEKILAWLLEDDCEEKLSVIPIVGIGGLGKTTLARLIYNDARVWENFHLRAWVSVNQDFDVTKVSKLIVEALTWTPCDLIGMEPLRSRLLDILDGRRFFIVFDDVWNEEPDKWDLLKSWLSRCARGSKIIVTTRSEKVGLIMGTTILHRLDVLSDDDCWSLFRNLVFDDVQEVGTQGLIKIGKEIVAKCKGLPLAVKALGRLLHFKREESEWLSVKDVEIYNLPIFETDILPILKLSYHHLPSHLKQCFAYCSIFPKDCTIKKDKLIQLWMAEGFIYSSQGQKRLEDVGNDYFMELLWSSFFKVTKEDGFGNITEFKVHVIIHDLARSVSRIGCSIVEAGVVETLSETVRHSSLICDSRLSTIPEALYKGKKLRTLLLFAEDIRKAPSNMFSSFRCLRVLDLSQSGIGLLPASIGTLKHLRYLDLSHTSIEKLPESMINLRFLQTLRLLECYCLRELPEDIKEMTNLRHLDICLCSSLSRMPSGIGKLTCLQTLPIFIVDKRNQCSLGELGKLNIGNTLEIKNLEYVRTLTDASDAKLKEKQNLISLGLSWGHDFDASLELSLDEVLDSLQPHSNLKELRIRGYDGISFPKWMGYYSLLQNLVKISLTDCRNCELLPPLGQLLFLKELYVKGMLSVKSIGNEFYGDGFVRGFPSLKQLELYDMPNLIQWLSLSETEEGSSSNVTKAFPCLKTLTVEGCPKLTSFPLLPVLKELALWNSNEMLLCSVANLTSLSSLLVNELRELTSFPEGLGNLSSIEKLAIYDCQSLMFLSEEGLLGLTSLQHLSILYCNKLTSLSKGLSFLISLRKLDIKECQELAFLPVIMQDIPSLEELIIDGCPELAALPFGMQNLVSLRKLIIMRCPKLEHFPIGFESIPALEYLSICGCPQLEKRLEERGTEWAKIAHIPYIVISDCNTNQRSVEFSQAMNLQRSGTLSKHANRADISMVSQLSTTTTRFSLMKKIWSECFGLVTQAKSQAVMCQRSGTLLKHTDSAKEFMLPQLVAATNNFSSDNVVGHGGFGFVYKGMLADGREVAIKRVTNSSWGWRESFVSEIEILSRLHHKHLVRLVGFCEKKDERFLVYEYMKNGSLYDHLHTKNYVVKHSNFLNSWKTRIKISLDTARGIEYLHNYADPPVIHRDIKPSNILIDVNWMARLSGFGMSIVGPKFEGEGISTTVAGTLGYLDPDYCQCGVVTAKSDVYSLGVVMLEILMGKKAFSIEEPRVLVEFAVPKILAGELDTVLDMRVGAPEMNEEEAVKLVAHTAVKCVNTVQVERPTMTDVVHVLERALAFCNGSHGSIKTL